MKIEANVVGKATKKEVPIQAIKLGSIVNFTFQGEEWVGNVESISGDKLVIVQARRVGSGRTEPRTINLLPLSQITEVIR